jgi:hypothetical protein
LGPDSTSMPRRVRPNSNHEQGRDLNAGLSVRSAFLSRMSGRIKTCGREMNWVAAAKPVRSFDQQGLRVPQPYQGEVGANLTMQPMRRSRVR